MLPPHRRVRPDVGTVITLYLLQSVEYRDETGEDIPFTRNRMYCLSARSQLLISHAQSDATTVLALLRKPESPDLPRDGANMASR